MLTSHTATPATSQDDKATNRDSRNEKFGDDFKTKRPYFHFIAVMLILLHTVTPVAIFVVVSRVTVINMLWCKFAIFSMNKTVLSMNYHLVLDVRGSKLQKSVPI